MRKALIILVVATVILALGVLLVALVNHREAQVLAERAVEARALDHTTGLLRRLHFERPLGREQVETVLQEMLGDELLYVAVALPGGETLLSAGPVPAADAAMMGTAVERAGSGPRDYARRRITVGGEEVVEVAIAAPIPGRGMMRAVAGRVWRELLGGEFGGIGGPGRRGPPILRLGVPLASFRSHLQRARGTLLLSLIVAPLIVAASLFAALVGRRALRTGEEAARRERLASLGELAATVAHEIRNPLGAIKGYAQLVEEGAGEAGARRAAGTMKEECSRIERTVAEVLGYARDAQPRLETLDLREVVDAELERAAKQAEARDVRLVRDYGDERVEVRGDRDQLARLSGNLVENALSASPPGGRVVVALRPARRTVELSVGDEGPGVPPGDRERVFEPFFSRRTGGTGLGLALVRRIAEAHGGGVRVVDRVGGGAEFVVRLPR